MSVDSRKSQRKKFEELSQVLEALKDETLSLERSQRRLRVISKEDVESIKERSMILKGQLSAPEVMRGGETIAEEPEAEDQARATLDTKPAEDQKMIDEENERLKHQIAD